MKRVTKIAKNSFPNITAITDIPNNKEDLLLVLNRFNIKWSDEEICNWLKVFKNDVIGEYSIHTVVFDYENKNIYNAGFNLDCDNNIDRNISFCEFKKTFGNNDMLQGYGITNIYDLEDNIEDKIKKCRVIFDLTGDEFLSNLSDYEIKGIVDNGFIKGNLFYSLNSGRYFGFKYDSELSMKCNKNKVISAKKFIKKFS